MPSDLGFYPFAGVLFILLCLLLCRLWRCGKTTPLLHRPLHRGLWHGRPPGGEGAAGGAVLCHFSSGHDSSSRSCPLSI